MDLNLERPPAVGFGQGPRLGGSRHPPIRSAKKWSRHKFFASQYEYPGCPSGPGRTGKFFGFRPGLPKKERQVHQVDRLPIKQKGQKYGPLPPRLNSVGRMFAT